MIELTDKYFQAQEYVRKVHKKLDNQITNNCLWKIYDNIDDLLNIIIFNHRDKILDDILPRG